jgi:hypothetical protein
METISSLDVSAAQRLASECLKMKPKYGRGVGVAWDCNSRGYAQSDCGTETQAGWGCAPGQWAGHICSGGTSPYRVNPSVAGIFPLSNKSKRICSTKAYTMPLGESIMKSKYEKPIAVPLGEALKGSGECNAGSAVMPGLTVCTDGGGPPKVGVPIM